MSTLLQRLIQTEVLEAEVCYEFDRQCGRCQWCAVKRTVTELGLPFGPRPGSA